MNPTTFGLLAALVAACITARSAALMNSAVGLATPTSEPVRSRMVREIRGLYVLISVGFSIAGPALMAYGAWNGSLQIAGDGFFASAIAVWLFGSISHFVRNGISGVDDREQAS